MFLVQGFGTKTIEIPDRLGVTRCKSMCHPALSV